MAIQLWSGKVAAATMAALTPANGRWVNQDCSLQAGDIPSFVLVSTALPAYEPVTGDLAILKVYLSHGVETGIVGSVTLYEMLPPTLLALAAGTVIPTVSALATLPLAATAESLQFQVNSWAASTANNTTLSRFGWCALAIFITTAPSPSSDLFIDIYGHYR